MPVSQDEGEGPLAVLGTSVKSTGVLLGQDNRPLDSALLMDRGRLVQYQEGMN
jgi:hypothetical protein